jgi:hypothetical protein
MAAQRSAAEMEVSQNKSRLENELMAQQASGLYGQLVARLPSRGINPGSPEAFSAMADELAALTGGVPEPILGQMVTRYNTEREAFRKGMWENASRFITDLHRTDRLSGEDAEGFRTSTVEVDPMRAIRLQDAISALEPLARFGDATAVNMVDTFSKQLGTMLNPASGTPAPGAVSAVDQILQETQLGAIDDAVLQQARSSDFTATDQDYERRLAANQREVFDSRVAPIQKTLLALRGQAEQADPAQAREINRLFGEFEAIRRATASGLEGRAAVAQGPGGAAVLSGLTQTELDELADSALWGPDMLLQHVRELVASKRRVPVRSPWLGGRWDISTTPPSAVPEPARQVGPGKPSIPQVDPRTNTAPWRMIQP